MKNMFYSRCHCYFGAWLAAFKELSLLEWSLLQIHRHSIDKFFSALNFLLYNCYKKLKLLSDISVKNFSICLQKSSCSCRSEHDIFHLRSHHTSTQLHGSDSYIVPSYCSYKMVFQQRSNQSQRDPLSHWCWIKMDLVHWLKLRLSALTRCTGEICNSICETTHNKDWPMNCTWHTHEHIQLSEWNGFETSLQNDWNKWLTKDVGRTISQHIRSLK